MMADLERLGYANTVPTAESLRSFLLSYAGYLDARQGERWRAQIIVLANLLNFINGDMKMFADLQDFIPLTETELLYVAHGGDSIRGRIH
jgi:hypothetical protein